MGFYLLWRDNSEPNPQQLPGACVAKWRYAATKPPDGDAWIEATPEVFDQYMATVHQTAYDAWAANPPPEIRIPDAEEVWQQKLAGTWTDPVTGLTFETSILSRDTIAGQSGMLQVGLLRGKIAMESTVPVWPVGAAEPAMLTVQDTLDLWFRFGLAWQQMYNEFCP